MRRLLILLPALLLATMARAQLMGFDGIVNSGKSLPGSCAASKTYLKAVTGLSVTETSAYDTMICTFVADGLWQYFDFFYIYANANHANTLVNAKDPGTFNAIEHGTCTFTIDRGITGNGSTCYHDTQFNPSTAGGHYSLNQAILGVCVLNNRTTDPGNNPIAIGAKTTASNDNAVVEPFFTLNTSGEVVNTHTGGSAAVTTAQGHTQAYRTGSAADTLFVNGVDKIDNFQTSTARPNSKFFVFNVGVDGSPGTFWSPDQIAVVYGGGADPADTLHSNPAIIRSVIQTMLISIGAPNVC